MPKIKTFTEVQRFGKSLLIVVVFFTMALALILASGLYVQLVQGKPFGNNPMSNTGLIITAIAVSLVAALSVLLLTITRLETTITPQTISFRFRPFMRKWKTIAWEEVKKAEVVSFNPIGDYGGWGISSSRKGKAYTTKGNMGLLLSLNQGKPLLIGTQKPNEIKQFIRMIDKDQQPTNDVSAIFE